MAYAAFGLINYDYLNCAMELSEKFKICLLLLFAHILISLFTIIPGYLSIDEITYHLMAKNFSESGGFENLINTLNQAHEISGLISSCVYT